MSTPDPHADHQHAADVDGLAHLLDLDAEVLAEHIADVTAWLPVRAAPIEILDLGAGTGAGTFALLHQFPEARVTAVDSSAAHLKRLQDKAHAANLSDRVHIVQADLDAWPWPDFGTPDLVWASASMHHLVDPDRALRSLGELLDPEGLVAIVELDGFPRFLPAGAPEDAPGLEERCHAATQPLHAEQVPHRGADWGLKLAAAGFRLQDRRTVHVDIQDSPGSAVGPYALATLQRIRDPAAAALGPADVAALDRLLDPTSPHSILHRTDLGVQTTRTVWAGRRTSGSEA
jgi:SAM-dependent methyltransferase